MKSIILSVSPQEALNILNGKQTALLRKRVPKGFVGWCYLYVNKDYKFWNWFDKAGLFEYDAKFGKCCGLIPARFWFDEYTEFDSRLGNPKLYIKACVSDNKVADYGKGKNLYAIHIKNLEIFNEPKSLGEFKRYVWKTIYSGMDCPPYSDEVLVTVCNAPTNYIYVEVVK